MKPSVRRSQQQDLIDAWHGPESAAEIALRLGLGDKRVVFKYFADLKRAGLLPDGVRPHFAASVVPPPACRIVADNDEKFARSLDRDVEASERLAEQTGLRIPDLDPLFARLCAVHRKDRRRRVDTDASEMLAAFERLHRIPSPALLMNAARTLDRTMARTGA